MIQGVYKFRTDIRRTKREQHRADQRIFDMQINRICRLILFVKYLFTFRMQEAKAALDLDKELSPEEEIEDVYGIDFMESLPNIDDGEMVEIRIKCTAEKCE